MQSSQTILTPIHEILLNGLIYVKPKFCIREYNYWETIAAAS